MEKRPAGRSLFSSPLGIHLICLFLTRNARRSVD